nr:PIN domain-containing protein [Armatimonas sp.]
MPRPKLFLDSSAVIAAALSSREDSPGRQLLLLGEAGVVDLRISREVLSDLERLLRKRNPSALARFVVLLDVADVATVPDPAQETVERCVELTGYLPDARVLAAAVECDADLFVTHDTEHFLQNPLIGPPDTRLRVKDSRQALLWCREKLGESETNPA